MTHRALLFPLLALTLMNASAQTAGPAIARADQYFYEPGKLRALILSGHNSHDWRTTTPYLKSILDETQKFDTRVTEEPAGLNADVLSHYDVVISNYNGPRLGATAEKALEEFVRGGKGLVVVHHASAAFGDRGVFGEHMKLTPIKEQPWTAWAEMIGTRWSLTDPETGKTRTVHGPRHVFAVKWTDTDHPITRGLNATFEDDDELYHAFVLGSNLHVLATAYDDPQKGGTGKDQPVIWTVNYGSGRVYQTALGHDSLSMARAGFVDAFARAVEWAATGAVTIPVGLKIPASKVTEKTSGVVH